MNVIPAGARPFADFAVLLRDQGFAVVSDQTVAFLRSIALLGPRSLLDVYWAARATLAPGADRIADFDALFDAFFREESGLAAVSESAPDERTRTDEASPAVLEPLAADSANELGVAASQAEALSAKTFPPMDPAERLERLARALAGLAPRRVGFRREPAKRGDKLDLRRSLSGHVEGRGRLAWTRRRKKLRRVLLLIDISGSMKAHTDDYLRFAHVLTQCLPSVETFSFGTRLSRLTKALRRRDVERALSEIAPAVADWSGGTRIGESMAAFLAIPRFSRASRGALVIVLSDGLERGEVGLMASAVRRLAARSWRLAWLTPLAADPAFSPATAGLKAVLPFLDHLGDGSSIETLCDFVETSAVLGHLPRAAGRSVIHGNAHHRRSPPHLAPGGPSLARWPHGSAHLRAV